MYRMARLAEHLGELPAAAIPSSATPASANPASPESALAGQAATLLYADSYYWLRRKLADDGKLPMPVLITAKCEDINVEARVDFSLALQNVVRKNAEFLSDLEDAITGDPGVPGLEIEAVNDLLTFTEIHHGAIEDLTAIDPQADAFFNFLEGAQCFAGFDESLHTFEVDEESISHLKAFVAWAHEHLDENAAEAAAPSPKA
jgi:hypothetical protein